MIDPITVSVLTHRFEAIVQEMGEAMLRTAYSQILNSSRDFSTAICDDQARLVAQAEHVPIHVGAVPWAVAAVRDAFAGRVRPGDVFLLNDPYHGNNHLPDLTAFVPVFVEGAVAFWSVNRAHQSDIGGSTHGASRCRHLRIDRITFSFMVDGGDGGEIICNLHTSLAYKQHGIFLSI
jgi:N-methylhydantoinase B